MVTIKMPRTIEKTPRPVGKVVHRFSEANVVLMTTPHESDFKAWYEIYAVEREHVVILALGQFPAKLRIKSHGKQEYLELLHRGTMPVTAVPYLSGD